MNSIVFILVKGKKVKVFDSEFTQLEMDKLIKKGWLHTATLDTRTFLEQTLNKKEAQQLILLKSLTI
jgi:hypothetical protein